LSVSDGIGGATARTGDDCPPWTPTAPFEANLFQGP